jgi:pimeloyl-ACP methyl ester carboxylesterase
MADQAHEVIVGAHRISVTMSGSGGPAVVIEPGFGGTARSWRAIADALSDETTVMTYDRAAYGRSSRATDGRTATEIARDLHGVLDAAGIGRPVVVVGHSAGGVFVRAFAALYGSEVAGMILVESSHEAQEQVLHGSLPWPTRLLEAVTVPMVVVVPRAVRGGADRRSIIREFRSFRRLTAADQPLAAGALGDRPLVVLTRAPGRPSRVSEDWRLWHGLHEDLARLSANSRHVVTSQPGHYIHKKEPDQVTGAIRDVLRSIRAGVPLAAADQSTPS